MIHKSKVKYVICPLCNGDGKETCDNPDHGFLNLLSSFRSTNECRCPCCGWDEEYKIRHYDMKTGKYYQNDCDLCEGMGEVEENTANEWCEENNYDEELIYV